MILEISVRCFTKTSNEYSIQIRLTKLNRQKKILPKSELEIGRAAEWPFFVRQVLLQYLLLLSFIVHSAHIFLWISIWKRTIMPCNCFLVHKSIFFDYYHLIWMAFQKCKWIKKYCVWLRRFIDAFIDCWHHFFNILRVFNGWRKWFSIIIMNLKCNHFHWFENGKLVHW